MVSAFAISKSLTRGTINNTKLYVFMSVLHYKLYLKRYKKKLYFEYVKNLLFSQIQEQKYHTSTANGFFFSTQKSWHFYQKKMWLQQILINLISGRSIFLAKIYIKRNNVSCSADLSPSQTTKQGLN